MGGRGLGCLLRALSVNYRHFSGGLPDLLLLRAYRRRREGGERERAEASMEEATEVGKKGEEGEEGEEGWESI
eukprot:439612-Rhodomonas_salina.1